MKPKNQVKKYQVISNGWCVLINALDSKAAKEKFKLIVKEKILSCTIAKF